MSWTLTVKPAFVAASMLLATFLAGVQKEAVSQEVIETGVTDAHEQARRLLQRTAVTGSRSASASRAITVTPSEVPDGQEQARRLLSRPGIGTLEAREVEATAEISNPERVDAHTLAAHLLLKPTGY